MSVEVYSVSREGDRLLSPHFRVREFACHDGADTVKVDTALVALLEEIRAAAGGAVTITSGYRTPAYNAKVGGARYSQHLQGTAADITVAGAAPLLVGQMAEHYLGGRGGIGVYQTFTHVDTRSGRARWDQRSGRETAVSGCPAGRRGRRPDAPPACDPAAAGSDPLPVCKTGRKSLRTRSAIRTSGLSERSESPLLDCR